jgi:hypothetical protein
MRGKLTPEAAARIREKANRLLGKESPPEPPEPPEQLPPIRTLNASNASQLRGRTTPWVQPIGEA